MCQSPIRFKCFPGRLDSALTNSCILSKLIPHDVLSPAHPLPHMMRDRFNPIFQSQVASSLVHAAKWDIERFLRWVGGGMVDARKPWHGGAREDIKVPGWHSFRILTSANWLPNSPGRMVWHGIPSTEAVFYSNGFYVVSSIGGNSLFATVYINILSIWVSIVCVILMSWPTEIIIIMSVITQFAISILWKFQYSEKTSEWEIHLSVITITLI